MQLPRTVARWRRRPIASSHSWTRRPAAGDTAQFLNSARSALQRMLAARWHMAAGQITTAEVAARIGGESDGEDIRQLFALADEARYSGHEPRTIDFAHWIQVVRRGCGWSSVTTGRTPLTALLLGLILLGCQAQAASAGTGSQAYSAAALYNAATRTPAQASPAWPFSTMSARACWRPMTPTSRRTFASVREPLRLPSESRSALARAATLADPPRLRGSASSGLLVVGVSLLAGQLFRRHRVNTARRDARRRVDDRIDRCKRRAALAPVA